MVNVIISINECPHLICKYHYVFVCHHWSCSIRYTIVIYARIVATTNTNIFKRVLKQWIQCWLITSMVQWHLSGGSSTRPSIVKNSLYVIFIEIAQGTMHYTYSNHPLPCWYRIFLPAVFHGILQLIIFLSMRYSHLGTLIAKGS